jgi:hypothetical protein
LYLHCALDCLGDNILGRIYKEHHMVSKLHIALVGFGLVGAVLAAGPALTQVVACTDEAGKKTYARTCPPGTVSQKDLAKARAAPKANASHYAGTKEAADDLSRRMQSERIAREEAYDKMLLERKERCDALAKRLHMYEHAGSIEIVDPDTGLGTLVESAQRAATLKQLRQDIKPCR